MKTSIAIVLLLASIQAAMCTVSPDPKGFFPAIKGNLTKIVWAHAVNSQTDLERALKSDSIMMLEADVVVGKLNSSAANDTEYVPIMAHPPANESDLSLEGFLRNVYESNSTKGIKLDFKTIEAFEKSKPILAKTQANLTFPVFINADILSGPVNATATPVDARAFLAGARAFPEYIVSVGWTTRYGGESNIAEGRYSSENIQKMLDTLSESKVTQSVTYPVRAGLASNDIEIIKTLMQKSSRNATLTIWSSEGDQVDTKKLSNLIKDVGVGKVYVDVPEDLMKRLDISGASTIAATLLMSFGPLLITLILSRML